MKRLAAVAALLAVAVAGCSSPSTSSPSGATSGQITAMGAASSARQTPIAGATSSSLTATTRDTTPTTATNAAESLGQEIGAKIAFYAIAKAAGMDDSSKMDELASGICSRIESGKPATVGSWMADTFQLRGDVAGKVALAAIEFACPEYKSQIGS